MLHLLTDYVNWLKPGKKIIDIILVKENNEENKERKEETLLFNTVYLTGKRINQYSREDIIPIYVLKGAKADINKRIKDEADRKINRH